MMCQRKCSTQAVWIHRNHIVFFKRKTVLGDGPLKALMPISDMDLTISRRSEPTSRIALMGEQPNTWNILQPQVAKNQHRSAKPWGRSTCYPYTHFSPLSDSPSQHCRIYNAGLYPCLTGGSCSHPSYVLESATEKFYETKTSTLDVVTFLLVQKLYDLTYWMQVKLTT